MGNFGWDCLDSCILVFIFPTVAIAPMCVCMGRIVRNPWAKVWRCSNMCEHEFVTVVALIPAGPGAISIEICFDLWLGGRRMLVDSHTFGRTCAVAQKTGVTHARL